MKVCVCVCVRQDLYIIYMLNKSASRMFSVCSVS